MRTVSYAISIIALLTTACACKQPTQSVAATPATAPPPAKLAPILQPSFAKGQLSGDVSIADVVARAQPSVVSVSSTRTRKMRAPRLPFDDPFFRRFFGFRFDGPRERKEQGLGSGVVVSEEIILTNNHVVEGADEIKVTTVDDQELEAEVVGTDPKSDLAVLRVKDHDGKLKPIRIGNSSRLRLGDVVLAIGNPFGVGQTVTMGIVSATGRTGLGIVDYESFIQTDAAINPGNSGGALISTEGELVGINTAILSRSGGNMGIGFAIPTNMAQPIMQSILDHGKVVRGWLGVYIQDLKPELAEAMKLAAKSGVLVSDVQADSPAEKAGLKRGDVILKLDGSPVTSTGELRNRVAAAGANKAIQVELLREGRKLAVTVELGELDGDGDEGTDGAGSESDAVDGLSLAPLSKSLREKYEIDDDVRQGLVITDVDEDSLGGEAGLRPGDVVIEVNRQRVTNIKEFRSAWKKGKDSVLLLVHRQGSTIFMAVKRPVKKP